MPHVRWEESGVWTAAVGSVLLASLAILLSATIWHLLLKDQRVETSVRRTLSVFLISQFGKYLPGNVGQFVGRVVLARRNGVPAPISLATMLTEVLWNIGTAMGLAALALYLYVGASLRLLPPWATTAGIFVGFIALLAAPWCGVTLLKYALPGVVDRVFRGSELRPPTWGVAVRVSLLYVLGYVCMGAALNLQAQAFFSVHPAPLIETAGWFALAWLAGYILPGAPAGLGVREAAIVVLFAPLYGESVSVALGIMLRCTTTVADLLALLLGALLGRRGERTTQVTHRD